MFGTLCHFVLDAQLGTLEIFYTVCVVRYSLLTAVHMARRETFILSMSLLPADLLPSNRIPKGYSTEETKESDVYDSKILNSLSLTS